jgi:hypothetical protein
MAVNEWNWTVRKPHLGNSDYFKSNYVCKSSRFAAMWRNHNENQPPCVQKLSVSAAFQSKLIF